VNRENELSASPPLKVAVVMLLVPPLVVTAVRCGRLAAPQLLALPAILVTVGLSPNPEIFFISITFRRSRIIDRPGRPPNGLLATLYGAFGVRRRMSRPPASQGTRLRAGLRSNVAAKIRAALRGEPSPVLSRL
jgi:hypothetical protein